MAKTQTRRSVSLNRKVYNAIKWAAAESNKTMSQFLTDLIRANVTEVPPTSHYTRLDVAKSLMNRGDI